MLVYSVPILNSILTPEDLQCWSHFVEEKVMVLMCFGDLPQKTIVKEIKVLKFEMGQIAHAYCFLFK